jgi:hypothetical protein
LHGFRTLHYRPAWGLSYLKRRRRLGDGRASPQNGLAGEETPAQAAQRRSTGDSPETLAEHHAPKGDSVGLMLKLGGVERQSRFKR